MIRRRRRRLELDLLHERDWFGIYLRAACDPCAVAPDAALTHAIEGARRLWRTAIMLETLGLPADRLEAR